jgi:hypothetical protein
MSQENVEVVERFWPRANPTISSRYETTKPWAVYKTEIQLMLEAACSFTWIGGGGETERVGSTASARTVDRPSGQMR